MNVTSGSEQGTCSGNRDSGLETRDPEREKPPPGQLRWRARRGQRELDLILGRYLETRYSKADREEQRAFAALLERSDPDILDWLLGRAAAPAEMENVIRALTAAR